MIGGRPEAKFCEFKADPDSRNSLHYATSMQQELLRRAFDELTQGKSGSNLVAQAAMVATSLYPYGGRFSEQQAHARQKPPSYKLFHDP